MGGGGGGGVGRKLEQDKQIFNKILALGKCHKMTPNRYQRDTAEQMAKEKKIMSLSTFS